MTPRDPRDPEPIHRGPPTDDPLAARLFPSLAGEVRWGLERTRRILVGLGDPLAGTPVLHVGGTNGKGSVAHLWASVLRAAGLRTGLYTSPELISFRERILIDGRPLADEVLEKLAADLHPVLLRESPSLFEAQTALAALAFERAAVDAAVLEVGMGGRLDATNVFSPVLTAITNVSLEHVESLGDSVVAIAREKGGILKPGVPAFTAASDPAVREALLTEAAASGTLLVPVGVPRGQTSLEGSRVAVATRRWGRIELHSPLVGRHQIANIVLAVRALEALPPRIPVSAEAIVEGVARARPPGRFQVEREGDRTWILDAAHNPAAAAALAQTIDEVAPRRPRIGVVGILKDKDHARMLAALAPAFDRFVLTVPSGVDPSRRWDPRRAAVPEEAAVEVVARAGDAFGRARALAGDDGTVVVTGSSRLVGEGLRTLGRTPFEALPPSGDSG